MIADALDVVAVWAAVVDGAQHLLAGLLVAGLVAVFSTGLLVALPEKGRQEAAGGRVRPFEGADGELELPVPHDGSQARTAPRVPSWARTDKDAA